MGQAALTFLGVILGAAIAGTVSLWQVQLVTKREREARRELREQERRDRRETFQRETLLATQDAVQDLWVATTAIPQEAASWAHQGEPWPRYLNPTPLPQEWIEPDGRLGNLIARVFDRELSVLLIALRSRALEAVTAEAQDEAIKELSEVGGLVWKVNRRVSDLLPDLF